MNYPRSQLFPSPAAQQLHPGPMDLGPNDLATQNLASQNLASQNLTLQHLAQHDIGQLNLDQHLDTAGQDSAAQHAAIANILCLGMGWSPQTPGGLNRYLYELMEQLARRGDTLELCGIDLPPSTEDFPIHLTNLATPQTGLMQRLWQVRQGFGQRRLQRPDAINLHFALYSAPVMAQLPQDVPVTFSFHGPWALESQQEGDPAHATWLKQRLERYVYRRCDRFIVLSRAFGQILHETYGIDWDRIHILPGGVNTQRFQFTLSRPQARQQLGWPSDRPILLTPRRLVHRMGLDKLLHAMVVVRQAVPDIWLAIAGKGPLADSLQQQITELGLTDHVRLLGYVPDQDLPIAYQAADLTVVPSQSLEGFGLILVESLACGTPALCTPVGGMPDIIRPFRPELVTQDITPDAIADQLIALLIGQAHLPTRQDCQAYAHHHYDWRRIAPQVRQVLLQG